MAAATGDCKGKSFAVSPTAAANRTLHARPPCSDSRKCRWKCAWDRMASDPHSTECPAHNPGATNKSIRVSCRFYHVVLTALYSLHTRASCIKSPGPILSRLPSFWYPTSLKTSIDSSCRRENIRYCGKLAICHLFICVIDTFPQPTSAGFSKLSQRSPSK